MSKEFDPQWVSAAMKGDQDAITNLYKSTYNNVYLTIKSMIKAAEDSVLDLLQDTYVKAFQSLDKLENPEKFNAWVKSIARNKTIDYLDKRKPVLFSDLADDDNIFEAEDTDIYHLPEIAIDRQETFRLLKEILNSLPEGQRVVISMYYYQDMSIKEIAAELGRSEGTIKAQLSTGRKAIEKKVREMEKKNGIKLYSLAPMPFFLLLLQNFGSATAEADAAVLGYVLQAANVASGAAVAAETTAAVSTGAAAAAASSGATAAAASASATAAGGLAAKIAAIPLVVKGIAAITAVSVGIGCIAAAVPGNDPTTPTEPVVNQTVATETFYETAGTTQPSFLFTEPNEIELETESTEQTTVPTEVLYTEPVTEPSCEAVTESSTEPSSVSTEPPIETATEPSTEPSSESDEEETTGEETATESTVAIVARGACGDNLTWVLTDDGILTISGEGAMDDYFYDSSAPWYDVRLSITTIIIEDDVTSIGDFAFYDCNNLISATIPDSVISIGNYAFCLCVYLTDVNIPNGVTTINSGTFEACISLTEITIPDNVTTIDLLAFSSCHSLTSINIPNGVTSIGDQAFRQCAKLMKVTIPSSVTNIGSIAFDECDSLTGIWVDENNAYYVSDEYGVLFNKDKTELIQAPGAISGNYVIPESVTTIGDHAFCGCEDLTGITISSGVTSIGHTVFWYCTSLTELTFEGDAPSIDGSGFYCVTATVYYPAGNDTWTASVMKDYGGTLTWVAYDVAE